ncbi:MAG TPA: hypothetical protein VGD05_02305 [Pyrinomonadaceae bacterium]|jgi:hypothetical protein
MIELTGSEKQIKWANEIRTELVERLSKVLEAAKIEPFFKADNDIARENNAKLIKGCEDFIGYFANEINNASVLIDYRSKSLVTLALNGLCKSGKLEESQPAVQSFQAQYFSFEGLLNSAERKITKRGQ